MSGESGTVGHLGLQGYNASPRDMNWPEAYLWLAGRFAVVRAQARFLDCATLRRRIRKLLYLARYAYDGRTGLWWRARDAAEWARNRPTGGRDGDVRLLVLEIVRECERFLYLNRDGKAFGHEQTDDQKLIDCLGEVRTLGHLFDEGCAKMVEWGYGPGGEKEVK